MPARLLLKRYKSVTESVLTVVRLELAKHGEDTDNCADCKNSDGNHLGHRGVNRVNRKENCACHTAKGGCNDEDELEKKKEDECANEPEKNGNENSSNLGLQKRNVGELFGELGRYNSVANVASGCTAAKEDDSAVSECNEKRTDYGANESNREGPINKIKLQPPVGDELFNVLRKINAARITCANAAADNQDSLEEAVAEEGEQTEQNYCADNEEEEVGVKKVDDVLGDLEVGELLLKCFCHFVTPFAVFLYYITSSSIKQGV